MTDLAILIVAALAGARTWRLLAHDTAGEPARKLGRRVEFWFMSRGRDNWAALLEEGWSCPFCLGFWVTSLWVVVGLLSGGALWWLIPAGCFAANFISGQLNAWLDVKPVTDGGGEIEGLDDEDH